jgi:hypothetical protein
MVAAAPATSIPRVAAQGAAYMALQPTDQQGTDGLKQRAIEAAKGAGLGVAGSVVGNAVGKALNPIISPYVKQLMDEGVTPTPGQIIGGGFKKAEEAARSIPILGDAITMAHKRALDDFNRAAINRALTPISKSIENDAPIGYKGVESAYNKIDSTYDDLLPKLKIQSDPQFKAELDNLKTMAQNLNPAQATQFNNIINNELESKFTPAGLMSGETMQNVKSKLGQLSRGYSKDQDYNNQLLGDALQEAQSVMRKMVARNNPNYAGDLNNVDTAYANLLRVENASAKSGAKEGIFTPNQLESATRAMDTSLRKRASSHGKALMQDLATAGDSVLSQKLPNSGTVDRALYGLGGLASGVVNPAIPAGLVGGAGLYTQPVQNALAAILTKRPELLKKAGDKVKELAPYAGVGAIGLSQ